MAIRIRNINKIVEDNGIKMLVHGPSGAGKTRLCTTTGEPTLIISAESGLLSIKDIQVSWMIKGVEIDTISDLEEIYAWLEDPANAGIFKWVCLDSITEIAERILSNEKAEAKDPRKAYGELQDKMMILMRRFRDLKGYNVLMSAKQQRIQDETGPAFYTAMMPGAKLHQQIPYIFDEVFALRVEKDENGEDYRVIQTGRDIYYEAKDRSGCLRMFEKPDISKIVKKIKGAPKAKEEKPKSILDDLKEKIQEKKEPEENQTSDHQEDDIVIIDDDQKSDETEDTTTKEGE